MEKREQLAREILKLRYGIDEKNCQPGFNLLFIDLMSRTEQELALDASFYRIMKNRKQDPERYRKLKELLAA